VSNLNVELGPKRLELLHELIPTATLVAFLVNQENSNTESQTRDLQAAARRLGLKLHVLQASTERDLDTAFASLSGPAGGRVHFRHRWIFR
jgi:putative ABC transport system substrate-binding protein